MGSNAANLWLNQPRGANVSGANVSLSPPNVNPMNMGYGCRGIWMPCMDAGKLAENLWIRAVPGILATKDQRWGVA
jgi:hypothetical protein